MLLIKYIEWNHAVLIDSVLSLTWVMLITFSSQLLGKQKHLLNLVHKCVILHMYVKNLTRKIRKLNGMEFRSYCRMTLFFILSVLVSTRRNSWVVGSSCCCFLFVYFQI